nr:reverse transcriptase domain-containing protein [Tanacetum cinerariifolium]
KQAHASHKAKNIVSTTRCLELLHMDLFGPSIVRSYGGNHYTLVIVDDYSRWSLDELAYGVLFEGPYQTNLPSPDVIISYIREDREATSINQTSSSQENTSSSFQSKLHISLPSSNEPTSSHPLNLLLDNISDVPPRPLNPQPLQSHPSLDITLSLSPITPLDHIDDTQSPPSPPQPQRPIMGHPLYYNYHDYHGLGEGIQARLDARRKNWIEELPHVLWAHRTMIKSSNEDTPCSLTYGTKAVISVEICMPTLRIAEADQEGPYEVTEALGKGAYKLRGRDEKQLPQTWNISNLKKCHIHKMLKKAQEKDKIGSKRDKNGKRGEAEKNQK